MKIRLEQVNPVIGDLDGNHHRILEALRLAEEGGVDLLILPEMVLTGYPAQDLLLSTGFCRRVYSLNREIADRTRSTALLFGTLLPNESGTGKGLHNSALLCSDGREQGCVHKTLLPDYDIFDESRYFEPNRHFRPLELNGVRIGVTICEDIWQNETEAGKPLYRNHPALELKKGGADLLVNISASPYTFGKQERREQLLASRARELDLPLLYCNQAGAQTDVVFEGNSMAMDRRGRTVTQCAPFKPSRCDLYWSVSDGLEPAGSQRRDETLRDPQRRRLQAITTGIRDYLEKTGVSDRLLLGLSGGIDSALVAVLAVEAVGPGRVTALTMPGEYSSRGSVSDSQILADRLGIVLHELSIQSMYRASLKTLSPVFGDSSFGVAEENLQSRMRGSLLMAVANKRGSLLLATGNKSELAVGYATLYGDMNGGLNPVGDLYKSEVYTFCHWLNEVRFGREMIPEAILEKEPSAELRPDQKDSDSLPPYDVLDRILRLYLEKQQDQQEIMDETGYDIGLVRSVLTMVDRNEFKRNQAPPIIKLSGTSFGIGRRWPMVQGWSRNRA